MIFRDIPMTRLEDYDRHGNLSVVSAVKLFENAGSHHSDSVKDSVIAGSLAGTALIIAEWRIEARRYPAYGERLLIETWVTGKAHAAQTYREFRMTTEDGEPLLSAQAKLVLFDLTQNKLLLIEQSVYDLYLPEERSVFAEPAPRLLPPRAFEAETPFALRRADIDYNGHVHNTAYFDFALEMMPQTVANLCCPASARLLYRTPVKAEESVTLKLHTEENRHTVCLFRGDGTLCALAEMMYKE